MLKNWHDSTACFAEPGHEAVTLEELQVTAVGVARPLLDIPTLRVCAGERIALVGPSGAGKTTLLRLINGYVTRASGSLSVLGHSVDRRSGHSRALRRRVGYVFQNFALIQRATVLENVLMGRLGWTHSWRSLLGGFSERDREIARESIAEVGLEEKLEQRADSLSGGQQQRVAIARMLAQQPDLILADEPVSNLDPALTQEILDLLVTCSQRRETTLIVSLHQPGLAETYAERIVALDAGRVVWDEPVHHLTSQRLQALFERRPISVAV